MKNNIDYSVIISTCDAFSDLWDAYFDFFKKNWADCPAKVYLVTDKETSRRFDGIEIIAAGAGAEITERLAKALEKINTEYILFTLEDYFLIQKIENAKLDNALQFMNEENVDYIRLYGASQYYLRKEGARESVSYPGFYFRDISEGNYKVSLYAGLWRTDFMRKTLGKKQNAWQYEVSLTQMARDLDACCVISNNREFPILDVIRKGKLLHRAKKYLKENGCSLPSREVIAYRAEFSIWFRTKLRHIFPQKSFSKIKRVMVRRGHRFYSKD